MSKTTPSTAQTPAAPSESGSDSLAALQERIRAAEARLAASEAEQTALNQALTEARLTAHARETRILEAQVEIRILEGARDAAHARLETARAEVLTLTRLLAQSEPRAGGDLAPETFTRTLDRQAQQLEAQTREMAELTRLLAESEQQTRALQRAKARMITWLPELMEALVQDAGPVDPAGARLSDAEFAECAHRLMATGAFDPEYYLTTNPDVAESGTDPALHFVKYGLTEGRAPRDLNQPRQRPAAKVETQVEVDVTQAAESAPTAEIETETGDLPAAETPLQTEETAGMETRPEIPRAPAEEPDDCPDPASAAAPISAPAGNEIPRAAAPEQPDGSHGRS